MLVAARRGIAVTLHTPSEVRAAITGSGRASKEQVGAMVSRILRLEEAPRPADADAPWPWPSATSGAAAPQPGSTRPWRQQRRSRRGSTTRSCRPLDQYAGARRPQSQRRAGDVIAQVSGTVLQVGPTSAVIEVGGLGVLALCSPNTVAGLRVGQRHAGHRPDRPRGLAHPVRLRLRRRAGVLRVAVDRVRGRSEAGPGGARRAQPRRSAPGDRHREPRPALARCQASAARAHSGS